METDKDLLLKPLLREEAWQLFCRGAFKDGICQEGFTEAAEQVCAKRGGLPLAIKAVAAAMRNNTNISEWRRALDFLERGESSFYGGESSEEEGGVLKRLEWSYKQLPNEAFKMCFVYCAAYPEDFWIESHDIIRLWIAEGLVQDIDRGEDVLIKLTDRCLLEWRDCTDPYWEPLCIFRAGKNMMHKFLPCNLNCERLSLMGNRINSLPPDFNYPNLVSLWLTHNPIDQVDAVMNTTCLKILDLSHTEIQKLPEDVSQLKHLVFLKLSYTSIEALPEAVVDLRNLQILVLRYCWSLSSLPSGIHKLRRLTHLDLCGSYLVRSCPRELSHLTSLQTLRLYRCLTGNEEAESSVMRAKDVANLQRLKELQLAVELPLAEGVIKTLPAVRVLTLHCAGTNEEDLPGDIQRIAIHENLDFTLFGVREIPNRLCDFRNLRSLRVRGSEHLKELPELFKLPSLAVLGLRECEQLKGTGKMGFWSGGGFPMLECLSLSILPELELNGAEVGEHAMQMLKRLEISNCKKLKELPPGLDRLVSFNLRVLCCDDEFWDEISRQQGTMKYNLERIRKRMR